MDDDEQDTASQPHGQELLQPQEQPQQQQLGPCMSYDGSMNTPIGPPPIQSHHYQPPPAPQPQYHQQQQYQQPQQQQPQQQQYHQQAQQSLYNSQPPPPPINTYKAPFSMAFGATAVSIDQRATHLLAACESCLTVTRIPGVDMSFRRIMERKCPRCNGTLVLPQELMEMLVLYGSFVPESVAVTLVLGMMVLHPSLRPDFMAAAMNELLSPLQTDFVYDVAVPKRPEGLGMSLRMNQGNLVVGGFIDFENNSESPSVAARIIAVDDVLVAINKKYITSWSFEKSISMLAHAASPVYLTFRRRQAVMLL